MPGDAALNYDRTFLVTSARSVLGRYLSAAIAREFSDSTIFALGEGPEHPRTFVGEIDVGGFVVSPAATEEVVRASQMPNVRYLSADLGDADAIADIIRTLCPTHILDLAAVSPHAPPHAAAGAAFTRALAMVSAANELGRGPIRLVFASGAEEQGIEAAAEGLREPHSYLARSSTLASDAIDRAIALLSAERVSASHVRVAHVIGPGLGRATVMGRLVGAALGSAVDRTPLPAEEMALSRRFIDARDAANQLLAALVPDRPGAAESTGEEPLRSFAVIFEQLQSFATRSDERSMFSASGLDRSLRALVDHQRDLVTGAAAHANTRSNLCAHAKPASIVHTVEVVAEHRYEVITSPGLLAEIPQLIRERFGSPRIAVLTDAHVHVHHGSRFVAELRAHGLRVSEVVIPDGEGSKSITSAMDVIGRLLRAGIDRRGLLLNFGGGMITDTGGFVAATYMRGIAYVNIPTTLLSQLDSAIGGKVAVNVPDAKNFVGAFHHPAAVWSDPLVLATLDRRDLVAGIAEAIKIALIADPELFAFLERECETIIVRRDPLKLAEVIRRSASAKIALLAPDPYERDLRRVLNLGHTFAHPLEVELGYGRILHGEAVAHGLAVAMTIGCRRKLCSVTDRDRLLELLAAYDLPPPVEPTALLRACDRLDAIRLVRGNQLHYVIPIRIGHCDVVAEVDTSEIRDAVQELIALGGRTWPVAV